MTAIHTPLGAQRLGDILRAAGITHVVGLPDTQTAPLFTPESEAARGLKIVTVCREGEAFPLAAGLWAAGTRPIVVIQNTGLFEAGDSLRSVAHELNAPLDVIVGWRGQTGKLNAGYPDTSTELVVPTLEAWRIDFRIGQLADGTDLAEWLREGASRADGVRVFLTPQ